jgi:hypothetical protein
MEGASMKEIDLKPSLTIVEMAETFRKQSQEMIPGEWKFVGVRFYFVNDDDILSSPGVYSKGFEKEDYEVA